MIKAIDSNERVSVNLKMLIQMAESAGLLKLPRSAIRSRQGGGHLSRFKGRGMEFDESRLYQAGDDIRNIDWRVTARTGKTHTKLFREERERPFFISVDDRRAMRFASRGVYKSVQAAKLAALLAWAAQQRGDRLGGQVFHDSACRELKPQNGKPAVLSFFNYLLYDLPESHIPMTLEHTLARLVQHVRPGSLVYLISDFRGLEGRVESHIRKLCRHCDVVFMHIYDPLEAAWPGQGRYRLTDGQQEKQINSADLRQMQLYQDSFQQRQTQIQTLAKQTRARYVCCSTVDEPVQVLLS
jgi:uncharacterized protein (DUF58 family)